MNEQYVAMLVNEVDAMYVAMYTARENYSRVVDVEEIKNHVEVEKLREELIKSRKEYRHAVEQLHIYLSTTVIRIMEDAIINVK